MAARSRSRRCAYSSRVKCRSRPARLSMIGDGRGMAGAGVIETYVAELGRTLRGPRRAKADLLAEARDSLVDAAGARERVGLPREEAEREAVAEFGAVPDIAPGYQTELGLA